MLAAGSSVLIAVSWIKLTRFSYAIDSGSGVDFSLVNESDYRSTMFWLYITTFTFYLLSIAGIIVNTVSWIPPTQHNLETVVFRMLRAQSGLFVILMLFGVRILIYLYGIRVQFNEHSREITIQS